VKMAKSGLLMGFIPLIAFGIVSSIPDINPIIAPGVALVLAVVTGITDLKNRMILPWASVVIFGVLVGIASISNSQHVLSSGIIVNTGLAIIAFGSMLAGIPFTVQYARQMTEPSVWNTPVFLRVNTFMTGVWGAVFSIDAVLYAVPLAIDGVPSSVILALAYGVLACGIIFTLWYPGYIRKRIAGSPQSASLNAHN